MPVPVGKIVYLVVGKTKNDEEVLQRFRELPIYKKYVSEVGSGFTLVDNTMYWRPSDDRKIKINSAGQATAASITLQMLTAGQKVCSGYVEYETDLELTYTEKDLVKCADAQSSAAYVAKRNEVGIYGKAGDKYISASGLVSYLATDYEFSWPQYAFLIGKPEVAINPPWKAERNSKGMDPSKIRIWIKQSDENKLTPGGGLTSDMSPYFYAQLANPVFFPIQNWEKLSVGIVQNQNAENPAGITKGNSKSKSSGKSKFTTFNGDRGEIPLETLVDGQIEEMVGYGSPRQAAISTVIGMNERALYNLAAVETQNQFDSSMFMQGELDEFGQPKTIINKDGLPAIKAGEFTPSEISIQVRFSNSGQAYTGAQAAPDVPIMIQTYPYYDKNVDSFEFVADKFYFHYKPNNVTYSNIGAEWADINRVNNTPIIDFKNFRLMKISFEFIVAEKLDGVSSLYASCEAQLKMLRQMAIRPEYVQFTNLDTLFSEQLSYPDFLSSGEATYFAIVDMSITSVQRSRAGIDNVTLGAPAGSINRATVNMTVQEVHNTGPAPIFMPRITQPPVVPPVKIPEKDELCKSRFTWISPQRWVQKAVPHSCD